MKIKWLGHSCFLLTSNSGVRTLTDPFDEKVGYALPAVEADIVTTSHGHYDHSSVDVVKGDFERLDKPGTYEKDGIKITGVATFHDEENGAKRGNNIIFKFNIDGVNICHCGDLGHTLSSGQVLEIGDVDVLLVPVGGTYTVDAAGALQVVKQLKPAVTIPMHYKTEALAFPLDTADKFLKTAGGGTKAGKQEIELDKENLSMYLGVTVLDYK